MNDYLNSYDEAEKWCRQVALMKPPLPMFYDEKLFRKNLKETSMALKFPLQSLLSLVRTSHLEAIKLTTAAVRRNMDVHMERYCDGNSIVTIAKSAEFPPFLMARLLVDELTVSIGRKELAKIMREPRLITRDLILEKFHHSENANFSIPTNQRFKTRLSREVGEATMSDPLYGPKHDRSRHNIGVEFEVALEECLNKSKIPYTPEKLLRKIGSSRTPDILLKTPMAFKLDNGQWTFVCWIDSKAMFGDVETHRRTILPQCETYIHRFGPGMIIYWFGHAPVDRLSSSNGDISVVGWRLPEEYMTPTGDKQFLKQELEASMTDQRPDMSYM